LGSFLSMFRIDHIWLLPDPTARLSFLRKQHFPTLLQFFLP